MLVSVFTISSNSKLTRALVTGAGHKLGKSIPYIKIKKNIMWKTGMFLTIYSFHLPVFEVLTKKIHNTVLDIDLNGIWHTGITQHQYNHMFQNGY